MGQLLQMPPPLMWLRANPLLSRRRRRPGPRVPCKIGSDGVSSKHIPNSQQTNKGGCVGTLACHLGGIAGRLVGGAGEPRGEMRTPETSSTRPAPAPAREGGEKSNTGLLSNIPSSPVLEPCPVALWPLWWPRAPTQRTVPVTERRGSGAAGATCLEPGAVVGAAHSGCSPAHLRGAFKQAVTAEPGRRSARFRGQARAGVAQPRPRPSVLRPKLRSRPLP